ncbi:hypothetical protein [Peribacillus frigoritolerans]|nr:hypothetical protein [Peribacillus frigoritolerans]
MLDTKLTFTGCFLWLIFLPKNWLAEAPQPFTVEEAWQAVGGKRADK